jgi:hypothetical protein
MIKLTANREAHHIARFKYLNITNSTNILGVRSQKTYPVGWSLTPLTALLLLGIAVLCLVVAP